jgi:molecular chaperone DnaK (HSP70)
MRIGIDFGTTYTVVAACDRGNYPVVAFTDPAGDAHEFVPSVVAERAGELRFGHEALAIAAEDSAWTLVRSFKRLLGGDAAPGRRVQVGSTEIPLVELLSRFLDALRLGILERSNVTRRGARRRTAASEELAAVVGTPANALGTQRLLTLDGFRRAGFAVRAMLNEPSAGAFEYTHRHADTLSARREHVVVYDLGGGTFDASAVRIRGVEHEIVATAGVSCLGGDDFDEQMLRCVLSAAAIPEGALARSARSRLLDACREAKERLNPSTRRIAIDLESVPGSAAPLRTATFPASDYYAACAPLIDRTLEAVAPVIACLGGDEGQAAEASGEGALAGIYVVGGASALPPIGRTLRERFGRRVHRSLYPSAATAIGLAIACDEQSGFALHDVFSRNFVVFREGRAGAEVVLDPIFTGEDRLPRAGDAPVVRTRTYRPVHDIGHFRFLECRSVGGGAPVGDVATSGEVLFPFDPALRDRSDLRGIPARRLDREGPLVREEYRLDPQGIVSVRILDLESGYERAWRLE